MWKGKNFLSQWYRRRMVHKSHWITHTYILKSRTAKQQEGSGSAHMKIWRTKNFDRYIEDGGKQRRNEDSPSSCFMVSTIVLLEHLILQTFLSIPLSTIFPQNFETSRRLRRIREHDLWAEDACDKIFRREESNASIIPTENKPDHRSTFKCYHTCAREIIIIISMGRRGGEGGERKVTFEIQPWILEDDMIWNIYSSEVSTLIEGRSVKTILPWSEEDNEVDVDSDVCLFDSSFSCSWSRLFSYASRVPSWYKSR